MHKPAPALSKLIALLLLASLCSCRDKGASEERYSVLEDYGVSLSSKGPAVAPLDWPAALAHPGGAKLAASEEGNIDGAPYDALVLDYSGSPEAVMQHYLAAAEQAGLDHWDCQLGAKYCACKMYNAKLTLLVEYPSRPDGQLATVLIREEEELLLPQQRIACEGRLAPDFPSARIPQYPQAQINSASYDKLGMAELDLHSSAASEKVRGWYEAELAKLGFKPAESGDFEGGQSSYSEFSTDSDGVYIEYYAQDKGCQILLTYKTQEYVQKIGSWD